MASAAGAGRLHDATGGGRGPPRVHPARAQPCPAPLLSLPSTPWLPTTGTEDEEGWADYVARMAEDGAWAGHPELQAASLSLRRNIQVYQAEQPVWQITNWKEGDADGAVLRLSYHDGNHYNSVAGDGGQDCETGGVGEQGAAHPATDVPTAETEAPGQSAAPADPAPHGGARKSGKKARATRAAHARAQGREPSSPRVRVELSACRDGEGPVSLSLLLESARQGAGPGGCAAAGAAPPPAWTKPVGRNKKCPCGSGRKYKACCAVASTKAAAGSGGGAGGGDARDDAAAAGVEAKLRMIHI